MDSREYKLMTYTGIVVICAGLAALLAGAMLAGSIAIGTGTLLVLSAIVGSWWNSD
ncbi:MAG TPA: hypothetical protein VGE12_18225 [Noviherbaspirillum sp.]